MAEQLEINCLGMKCPRPIIEIAKAARKSTPGTILDVQSDDLAFESDVRAWTEHASATILELKKDGSKVAVKIKLAE